MAHDAATRQKAKELYIRDRWDLTKIADHVDVSEATLRRWKRSDAAKGDCWDRARTVTSMSSGGLENVTMMLVEDYIRLHHSTLEELKNCAEVTPLAKAEAISRLADAFNKTIAAAGRATPKLSELAIAMDIIKRLTDFVANEFPEDAETFLKILEPFGHEVSEIYG